MVSGSTMRHGARWLLAAVLAACVTGCLSQPSPPNLLYITPDGSLTLVSLDLASMRSRPVKTPYTGDVLWASWSGDGERVAVTVSDGECRAVVSILNPDEGTVDQFAGLSEPGYPVFAPASGLIAIDFGTGFGRELIVYRLDTKTPIHHLGYSGGFSWSPDGTRLMLGRDREVQPPMPWESGHSADVVVFDLATGEETELVCGDASVMYLPHSWPEPERVLVWRVEPFQHPSALVSVDLATGQMEPAAIPRSRDRDYVQRLLPESMRESFAGTFDWAPDFSAVAVVVRGENGPEVWLVRPAVEQTRNIRLGSGHSPAWRPRP